MAKKIIFPFDQKELFLVDECMQSALEQGVSLSSLDVRKANVILDISSKMFEVPRSVIVEYGRKREACFGRTLFAETFLSQTRLPLNCVGGFLSGRDHSTVKSMLEAHAMNLTSRDMTFDRYKGAAAAIASYIERSAADWSDENPLVITEKARIADLFRFVRTFGNAKLSEDAIKNYVRANPF